MNSSDITRASGLREVLTTLDTLEKDTEQVSDLPSARVKRLLALAEYAENDLSALGAGAALIIQWQLSQSHVQPKADTSSSDASDGFGVPDFEFPDARADESTAAQSEAAGGDASAPDDRQQLPPHLQRAARELGLGAADQAPGLDELRTLSARIHRERARACALASRMSSILLFQLDSVAGGEDEDDEDDTLQLLLDDADAGLAFSPELEHASDSDEFVDASADAADEWGHSDVVDAAPVDTRPRASSLDAAASGRPPAPSDVSARRWAPQGPLVDTDAHTGTFLLAPASSAPPDHAPHSALEAPSGSDADPASAALAGMSPRSLLASTSAVFHAPAARDPLLGGGPSGASASGGHARSHHHHDHRHRHRGAPAATSPAAPAPSPSSSASTGPAPHTGVSYPQSGPSSSSSRLVETIYLQPYDAGIPQSPQQALRMLAAAAPHDARVRRFLRALRKAMARGTLEDLIGDGRLAHALEDGTLDSLVPPESDNDEDDEDDEDEDEFDEGDAEDGAGAGAGGLVPPSEGAVHHNEDDRGAASSAALLPLPLPSPAASPSPPRPFQRSQGSFFDLLPSGSGSGSGILPSSPSGDGTGRGEGALDGSSSGSGTAADDGVPFMLCLGPDFDLEGFLADMAALALAPGGAGGEGTATAGRAPHGGYERCMEDTSPDERNGDTVGAGGYERAGTYRGRPAIPPLGIPSPHQGAGKGRRAEEGGDGGGGRAGQGSQQPFRGGGDEDGGAGDESGAAPGADDAAAPAALLNLHHAAGGGGRWGDARSVRSTGTHTARVGLRTLAEEDDGAEVEGSEYGGSVGLSDSDGLLTTDRGSFPPPATSRRGSASIAGPLFASAASSSGAGEGSGGVGTGRSQFSLGTFPGSRGTATTARSAADILRSARVWSRARGAGSGTPGSSGSGSASPPPSTAAAAGGAAATAAVRRRAHRSAASSRTLGRLGRHALPILPPSGSLGARSSSEFSPGGAGGDSELLPSAFEVEDEEDTDRDDSESARRRHGAARDGETSCGNGGVGAHEAAPSSTGGEAATDGGGPVFAATEQQHGPAATAAAAPLPSPLPPLPAPPYRTAPSSSHTGPAAAPAAPPPPAMTAAHQARLQRLARMKLLGGGSGAGDERTGNREEADEASSESEQQQLGGGEAALVEELTLLAQRLKTNSLAVHDRLQRDNAVLRDVSDRVDSNLASISGVTDKMSQGVASGASQLCEAFCILLLACVLFVACYVALRILPAPKALAPVTLPSALPSSVGPLRVPV